MDMVRCSGLADTAKSTHRAAALKPEVRANGRPIPIDGVRLGAGKCRSLHSIERGRAFFVRSLWPGQVTKQPLATITPREGLSIAVEGPAAATGRYVEQTASSRQAVWVLEPKALPSFLDHELIRPPNEDVQLIVFHLSRFVRSTQGPVS
jgi:hypothetical protein